MSAGKTTTKQRAAALLLALTLAGAQDREKVADETRALGMGELDTAGGEGGDCAGSQLRGAVHNDLTRVDQSLGSLPLQHGGRDFGSERDLVQAEGGHVDAHLRDQLVELRGKRAAHGDRVVEQAGRAVVRLERKLGDNLPQDG